MRRKVTPPQLAELWGISPDKVVRWIIAGELRAIDASTTRGGRPRYLIDVQDIEDFERRRQVVVATTPARRQSKPADIPEYV